MKTKFTDAQLNRFHPIASLVAQALFDQSLTSKGQIIDLVFPILVEKVSIDEQAQEKIDQLTGEIQGWIDGAEAARTKIEDLENANRELLQQVSNLQIESKTNSFAMPSKDDSDVRVLNIIKQLLEMR